MEFMHCHPFNVNADSVCDAIGRDMDGWGAHRSGDLTCVHIFPHARDAIP